MRDLPAPGSVDLFVVHDVSTSAATLVISSEEERAAAGYATERLALRSRAARGLMRLVASRYLGCTPLEVPFARADCVICGQPHGKPVIADSPVQINLSHTGDTVMIGIASSPVGVDVEPALSGGDPLALSARFYSPAEAQWVRDADAAEAEQRFLRLWVRKEAVLKATGEGLPGGLDTVPTLGATPLTMVRSVAGRASPWTVADVDAATHPSAAVALAGAQCRLSVLTLADLDATRPA